MGRRYGIYYIPDADSEFYITGSNILGYDIRRRVINSSLIREELSQFFYFGSAHYFGFHATLKGSFKTETLAPVSEKLESLTERQSPLILKESYVHSFDERHRVILFKADPETERSLFNLHKNIVEIVNECRIKELRILCFRTEYSYQRHDFGPYLPINFNQESCYGVIYMLLAFLKKAEGEGDKCTSYSAIITDGTGIARRQEGGLGIVF